MSDDPHYIPSADRADGEPGEGGCLRTEAEEREAAESAPEILDLYRARVREAEEAVNPPLGQPWPTQAAADMMRRGEWPPTPTRAPLKERFDQASRRGKWVCFGFSEDEGRRVPVPSPWREDLNYDDKGGAIDRSGRVHSEVLCYLADTKLAAKDTPARTDEGATGTKRLGYGKAVPALLAAMKAHEERLLAMRARKHRAAFLANKVGCSPSTAEKILKREGW